MAFVYCDGAVVVADARTNPDSTPPVVVGGPPQWHDDSDATYVELETWEHPDVSFADEAGAVLTPVPSITQSINHVTVTAHVRYQVLGSDLFPPRIWVSGGGFSNPPLYGSQSVEDVSEGSQAVTWYSRVLPKIDDLRTEVFLARIADGTQPITLHVGAPHRRVLMRTVRTRIFEAYLEVTGPTIGPPCRLYPGGIQGTVGGAVRQYPPQKYRQASTRGVGCY